MVPYPFSLPMKPERQTQMMKLIASFIDRGWQVRHWNNNSVTLEPKHFLDVPEEMQQQQGKSKLKRQAIER